MKVPIDEVAAIDLDAPVLSAYEARIKGVHAGSCGASTAADGTATGLQKVTGRRIAWTKAARTGRRATTWRSRGKWKGVRDERSARDIDIRNPWLSI